MGNGDGTGFDFLFLADYQPGDENDRVCSEVEYILKIIQNLKVKNQNYSLKFKNSNVRRPRAPHAVGPHSLVGKQLTLNQLTKVRFLVGAQKTKNSITNLAFVLQ